MVISFANYLNPTIKTQKVFYIKNQMDQHNFWWAHLSGIYYLYHVHSGFAWGQIPPGHGITITSNTHFYSLWFLMSVMNTNCTWLHIDSKTTIMIIVQHNKLLCLTMQLHISGRSDGTVVVVDHVLMQWEQTDAVEGSTLLKEAKELKEDNTCSIPWSPSFKFVTNIYMTYLIKPVNYLMFNVLWPEVPYGIPQYIYGILYGLTSILLCVPFIFAESKNGQFCGGMWYWNGNYLYFLVPSYFDCRGSFQTVVDSYCFVMGWKWILHLTDITGACGAISAVCEGLPVIIINNYLSRVGTQ